MQIKIIVVVLLLVARNDTFIYINIFVIKLGCNTRSHWLKELVLSKYKTWDQSCQAICLFVPCLTICELGWIVNFAGLKEKPCPCSRV